MTHDGITIYVHDTIWPDWYFATAGTKSKRYFASGPTKDDAVNKIKRSIDFWKEMK